MKIPLYKPYMPSDLSEIQNILYSDALAYGKWGSLFEEQLSEYLGIPYILTYNSYNSAMLGLLTTLDIGHRDEVIASPMSCLASNQPFVTQGAKVRWADIDPTTGTLDIESVKTKISKHTKAIFHNHHCGYVGHVDEINALGKEYGIPVIDDSIEAFGAQYKGALIGNLGTDFTVFSFETVRMPNCISGGAVVFLDKKQYDKAAIIRDYGVNRDNFRDELGEINPNCDITLPGYGIKPSEINSYIGVQQLKEIDSLLEQQRKNSQYWKPWLEEKYPNVQLLNTRNNTLPNYWVMGVLAPNKREMIVEMRERGYYASGVHLNNNRYSVFQDKTPLKGVDEFYSKFLALPSGWWVKQ